MMVYYLASNFLNSAVAARKGLLTKCLITVPQHLDECETLPCSGVIADEKYRKPWTRAKADEQFLLEESLSVLKDTSRTTFSVSSVLLLEQYNSGHNGEHTSSVIDIATFDLDCDIVPSSNPSSPEMVCSSDLDKEAPDILEETFQREDMTKFTVTLEELKIEPLLSIDFDDWHTEEAKNLVALTTLAGKLVEVPVTDPLAVKIQTPPLEKYCCGNGEQQPSGELLDQMYDAGIFNESVEKLTTESSTKFQIVEEIITTTTNVGEDINVTAVTSSLLSSVTLPMTVVAVETDLPMKKDILPTKNELLEIPRLESPDFGSDNQKHPSFLDINDTVDEKLDQFCDEALLDSPQGASQEKVLDSCITLPNCEPVSLSQSKPSILISEQRKKGIMEECFTYDYICDEIQAARLPEPKMVDMETDVSCVVVVVKDVIRMLELKEDKETKSINLDPQRELVTKSSAISLDKLVSLTYGNESKVSVEPVEMFKKYTPGDIEETYEAIDSDVAGEDCEDKGATILGSEMEKLGEGLIVQSIPAADTCNAKVSQRPKSSATCGPLVDSFDPLGDFMALRLKSAKQQRKADLLHEDQNESLLDEPDVTVQKPCKSTPEGKRGNKHHIVNVMLNDDFQTIVDMLKETAAPYVHQLQESGEISLASCFQSLTPDDTLFIVRQREKHIHDTEINGTTDSVYKAEVCLYALSQAAEYAVNCCLESVIGFLCAVEEEYAVVRKSVLGSVVKNLVDKQTEFFERKHHHPKVAALCKEIETWLRKKRLKSREQEQKILVLVKNATPNLVNCLKNALSCGNLLTPEILTSHQSEDILQILDAHNCLIVQHRYVQDTFPWAQFSLVVEFEYKPGSDWQEICQRQHIRHIGFLMHHQCVTENNSGKDWTSRHIDKQICLIGSQGMITSNTDLLQLLESKHNILVIERDYNTLPCQGDVFFSDVDVDADSCIVTENLSDLQDDCGLGNIVRRLVVLSLKYTRCFCLLTSTKTSNGYELPGSIITNLSRLKATTASLERKVKDYRVKLIQCTDTSEIASVIRCVSKQCMQDVKAGTLTQQQWLNRSWITQEITQEEKFLLMIPCLSSYSAQLMLRKMGINQLFQSSLDELKLQFPEIAPKIVEGFSSYIKRSRGLQLQSDCNYNADQQNNVMQCTYGGDDVNTDFEAEDKTVDVHLDSTQNMFNIEHSMIEQEQYGLEKHLLQNMNKNQPTDSSKAFKEKQLKESQDLDLCFGNESPDKNWGTKYNTRVQRQKRNGNIYPVNKTRIHEPYVESDVRQLSNFEKDSSKETRNLTLAGKLNQRSVSNNGDQNANTCSNYQSDSQYNKKQTQQERRPMPLFTHSFSSEKFKSFECLPSSEILEKVGSFDTNDQPGFQGSTNSFELHSSKLTSGNSIIQQQPIETFEYNHGLNSKEDITTSHLLDFAPVMANKQETNNPDQQAFLERMANFSREFPSAEEIDALVMLQNNNRESLEPMQDHTHIQWQEKVNIAQNTDQDLLNGLNTARLPKGFEHNRSESSDCVLKSGNSGLANNQGLENCNINMLSFKEPYSLPNHNHDIHNDTPNAKEDSSMLSGRLYLNPNLKRVSLRPSCITPSHGGGDGPIETRRTFNNSLQDDLRETTRRYLENSHQFSKLGSNNSRRHLQRVSIGLAQPQPRKTQNKDVSLSTDTRDSPSTVTRERVLMEQSLWATEDSPPMDLEEGYSPGAKQLANAQNFTNREVFTYQTPKKKRKLTYHCVPGRKGQTKLLIAFIPWHES